MSQIRPSRLCCYLGDSLSKASRRGDKMAQKVQVMLLCDLDDNNVDAAETLQFSLGNAAYEVDVCAKPAQQIRDGLEPFVEQARKVSASGGRRRQRTVGSRQETASIR